MYRSTITMKLVSPNIGGFFVLVNRRGICWGGEEEGGGQLPLDKKWGETEEG